jgi:hypothetical protein
MCKFYAYRIKSARICRQFFSPLILSAPLGTNPRGQGWINSLVLNSLLASLCKTTCPPSAAHISCLVSSKKSRHVGCLAEPVSTRGSTAIMRPGIERQVSRRAAWIAGATMLVIAGSGSTEAEAGVRKASPTKGYGATVTQASPVQAQKPIKLQYFGGPKYSRYPE